MSRHRRLKTTRGASPMREALLLLAVAAAAIYAARKMRLKQSLTAQEEVRKNVEEIQRDMESLQKVIDHYKELNNAKNTGIQI